MNAFLVLITVFMIGFQPVPVVQKLPFASVEACEAWLADPAQVEVDFGPLAEIVVATDARCEPRQDGKPV